jgi:hypothetical protein
MEKVVVVGIDISKDDIHACVKEYVANEGAKLKDTHKRLEESECVNLL